MSCCGKKRQQWLQAEAATAGEEPAAAPLVSPAPEPQKIFSFNGTGSLTVTGAFTGYTYYFPFPGARVKVDYHDAFALVAEPGLSLVPA